MNYSRFINELSSLRKPSIIREFAKFLTKDDKDLIFLAGGVPNPSAFPFLDSQVRLRTGEILQLDEKQLELGLQYGPTPGFPGLRDELWKIQNRFHNVPENSDIIVTSGSQDGLLKSVEMLFNPHDYILAEQPIYPGMLAILQPFSPKYLTLEGDQNGIIPESLSRVLEKWDPNEIRDKISGVPKILYIIPNGCNPTGVSITEDRRVQIYEIASQYNLIILEDDPYYFLEFKEQMPKSFLSLDTDGRVIRFDSFSKILSAGLRIGFVTGPKPLIERIALHMQCGVFHASALAQVMVAELLKHWGEDGFQEHVSKTKQLYQTRRDKMIHYASKHLSEVATWNVPTGGMFLWITIPQLRSTYKLVMEKGIDKKLLMLPGGAFSSSDEPSNSIRVTYSLCSEEQMDAGMRILRELIEEELKEQS